MYVRALLPDNGIFLFFLSLSAGNLSGSGAFARAVCAGHLLYISSACVPFPCVGDSINPFSHHVNRFIFSKTNNLNGKIYLLFDEIQKVKNWEDEDEVESYLIALLNQQAFDRAGLIYGMGHAVYSISDPRARTFRKFVQKLADEKGLQKEFALYNLVEKLAPKVIANERHIYKGVSANIDFYSGLVYSMLGIPHELYTPIFAIGRIAGWSAHRLEELVNAGKIIRPAYKAVAKHKPYTPLSERD